jgi:hypothetical protein
MDSKQDTTQPSSASSAFSHLSDSIQSLSSFASHLEHETSISNPIQTEEGWRSIGEHLHMSGEFSFSRKALLRPLFFLSFFLLFLFCSSLFSPLFFSPLFSIVLSSLLIFFPVIVDTEEKVYKSALEDSFPAPITFSSVPYTFSSVKDQLALSSVSYKYDVDDNGLLPVVAYLSQRR